MPFEKYDNYQSGGAEAKEWARLRYRNLVISAGAFARIGTPQRINLYWDAERRLVGVAPADPRDKTALRARKYGRNFQILAEGFTKRYQLPPANKAELFEPELIDSEHGPLLVLDWSDYLARTERQP
jgi:hypothetical protein